MDKFTKNAMIGCVLVCTLVIACFYAASALGHTELRGTDAIVGGQAAESGSKESHASWYELDQNGEYLGFTLAGMTGGFVAGYAWVMVFDETDSIRGDALG